MRIMEPMARDDTIEINSPATIEGMRRAGLLAASTLQVVGRWVRAGVSTLELNQVADKWTREHGGISAPLGYRGFPKSICTSVNDVVCHGIPSAKEVLRDGDIVNVDVTPKLDGYHGDTSMTYLVGEGLGARAQGRRHARARASGSASRRSRPGKHIGDIGAAIQEYAEAHGLLVVREYCGHGINRVFHTNPSVPHFGEPRRRARRCRPG